MVGKLSDEADSVGHESLMARAEVHHASGRIQRGEQAVLREGLGPGQGVHQRTLTGVGVTDQRDRELLAARADLTHLAAIDLLQLALVGPDDDRLGNHQHTDRAGWHGCGFFL